MKKPKLKYVHIGTPNPRKQFILEIIKQNKYQYFYKHYYIVYINEIIEQDFDSVISRYKKDLNIIKKYYNKEDLLMDFPGLMLL